MRRRAPALLTLLLLLPARPAACREEPEKTWSDEAELSLVVTNGNSDTFTLGFKNHLRGEWERWTFDWKVGLVRADATKTTRLAVGSPGSFDVRELSDTERTADRSFLALRGTRTLSERLAWFVGGRWERNELSGVRNRTSVNAGLSRTWVKRERAYFRTDHGLDYTREDLVVTEPGREDGYVGAQSGWEGWWAVGAHSRIGNDLQVDWNLRDTADLRADVDTWLAVDITERLGLKVSYRVLWDAQPASEEIRLFDPADLTTPIGTVLADLERLDGTFTAALTVSF